MKDLRAVLPACSITLSEDRILTEIVLLLGLLGFLAVRQDYLHRRIPFILSMIFWGTSRILTELTFKVEVTTGSLQYDWGSLMACSAAGCLFLCLFCIFLACLPRSGGGHAQERQQVQEQDSEVGSGESPAGADPSRRIRELIEE